MNSNLRIAVLFGMLVLVVLMWGAAFLDHYFEDISAGVAPLDPLELEAFSLVAVGTGETTENHLRGGPALAVGRGTTFVLVDAGRRVAEGLRAAQIPPGQPQAVFLTSLWPENSVGLDDLWLTGSLGRSVPLTIYGPAGTAALIAGMEAAQGASAEAQRAVWSLPPEATRLEAVELTGGEQLEMGGMTIRVAALAGGPLPALAYRFEAEERAIAITGSGIDPDAFGALAEGASLIVVEAIHGGALDLALASPDVENLEGTRREAALHLRLEDVGALASRASAQGVALTRLRPPPPFDFVYANRVQETFRGPVFVLEDGQVVTP